MRHIIAGSGGFVPVPGLWQVMRPGLIMKEALRRSGRDRPRVCLVMTASGDSPSYLSMMYAALADHHCDVDHLALFTQPNRPVDESLGRADVIWVGGGSVANLLALWRLHGVDEAMLEAWERGAVLGGVSAGSICWHVGGPTDSFGARLQPVTNALGLLPFGNGVHYDSEEQRRPLLHSLVADGTLPTSLATDDGIAIRYEGTDPVEVVADVPVSQGDPRSPDSGPAAYLVRPGPDGIEETRLPVGPINSGMMAR
jgi:peptidase E